jgi:hypothetical protein
MQAARAGAYRRRLTSGCLQRSHTIAPAAPDELRRSRGLGWPDLNRLSNAGASFDPDTVHAFGLQPADVG